MSDEALRDVAYRLPWRTSGVRLGAHKSRLTGTDGLFKDMVPLQRQPDPRRIALRASFCDPFETLFVQRSEQLTDVTVYVLVDVSASIAFEGRANKIGLAADFAAALSVCASRTGDPFGLVAFDSIVRRDLFLPKTRSRAAQTDIVHRLRSFVPDAPGIDGIADAAGLISGARKLVFLISDFLWPDDAAEQAFASLAHHDVIAIAIDDSRQIEDLPEWGLLRLEDLETHARRLVFMRPKLKAEWRRRMEAQRQSIGARASMSGREMFSVQDTISWDTFSSYLMYGRV